MSNWYEAAEDDIEVNNQDREVEIWAYSDDRYGNCYVTLTFDQVLKLAEIIQENE